MATTAAEIKDRESFEAWLTSLPGLDQHKTSLVLASRTALRVLPILGSRPPNSVSARLLLETLRAIIISRLAVKSPTQEILKAALSQVDGADFSDRAFHSPVSNAARFAAYTSAAITGNEAAAFAGDVADYAHDAASEGIWEAISADAVSLETTGFTPDTLISQPLWPNGPSEWWAISTKEFGNILLEFNKYSPLGFPTPKDWPIWLEWLNSVANGNQSFNLSKDVAEALEMRVALGDGRTDFWKFENPIVASGPISNSGFLGQKGVGAIGTVGSFDGTVSEALIRTPELINAEIAGWVRDARGQIKSAQSNSDELDETRLPRPFPAVTQFELATNGKITALTDPSMPAANRTDHDLLEQYEEARAKALLLSRLSPNQLGRIADDVMQLANNFPEFISDVSINRLWSKANTLRGILALHEVEKAKPERDRDHMLVLDTEVAFRLSDAIKQFNIYNAFDEHGRELDRLAFGPEIRARDKAALEASTSIVINIHKIADQVTTNVVTGDHNVLYTAPHNIHGDQALERTVGVESNLVVKILMICLRSLKAMRVNGSLESAAQMMAAEASRYGHDFLAFVVTHQEAFHKFTEAFGLGSDVQNVIDLIVAAAKVLN